ncbi:MAG: tRNA preQ1(34) S-adenosylmethionine ribosyltransferase-isomerase QueA [Candidatus Geothermincolia bacterium]
MRTDTFEYELPEELIAQDPLPVRDSSRLMVLDREAGTTSHRAFRELASLLRPRDCLVVNTSRVIPARLHGVKAGTGGSVELLLLENVVGDTWTAMTRGASLREGARVAFDGGKLEALVVEGPAEGLVTVELASPDGDVRRALDACGRVPLPPYIKHELEEAERYQTVYSEREISAAAPTAGLHFTPGLIDDLASLGVTFAKLELAVGMDTFVPVREEQVEDHRMHSEWFSLDEACAGAVNDARAAGGRIVAVGTTAVRVLETCATGTLVAPGEGYTDLFITPGYDFKAVDAVVTNFHFPHSTLLMLVCAFGGTDLVLRAYEEAVLERYRFYSFGDAMLVT